MIVVYWLEKGFGGFAEAKYESFEANELSAALKFAEQLRTERATQPERKISHVDVKSEMPDSVGKDGVSDAPTEYQWYKRRQDPAIPVGRARNSDDEREVDLG